MGILRDFQCLAHGNFESMEEKPLCPFGCDTVQMVFLQPPAFNSARTSNIDKTLESIAKSHGLTDMNNRGGAAVKRPTSKFANSQEEYTRFMRERYGDGWGVVPKGGTMNVKTKEVTNEGTGPGVAGALSQYHGHADNALAEVRDALVPKPVRVLRDHENLSVDMAK